MTQSISEIEAAGYISEMRGMGLQVVLYFEINLAQSLNLGSNYGTREHRHSQ